MRPGLKNKVKEESATNSQTQNVDFFEQKKKKCILCLDSVLKCSIA